MYPRIILDFSLNSVAVCHLYRISSNVLKHTFQKQLKQGDIFLVSLIRAYLSYPVSEKVGSQW